MELRSYLKENILLFDGGMGTYYQQLNCRRGMSCEMANLRQPELISAIHGEYLAAGCHALKTNTFSANRLNWPGQEKLVKQVLSAGWQLACEAAKGHNAWVFADIGPANAQNPGEAEEEYRFLADAFLELGAENFLFETNSSCDGLPEVTSYIRERVPHAYIIVSFAVQPDGYTRDGLRGEELLRQMTEFGAADALGLNCVTGARHMLGLFRELDVPEMHFSVMPNAGYPVVRGSRTYYDGDPEYFAAQLYAMAEHGAEILGGCCGTTPEHIRLVSGYIAKKGKPDRRAEHLPAEKGADPLPESRFFAKLSRGKGVIAVELDPPKDASPEKFMEGARELQAAGADIITIADCPIARARMDSSLLACKIRWQLGMEALPHMTCRDRNLNATKALVLGLFGEGIRNILAVTGDPIPTAERDEVKSVYQFNSRKLARYISSLGENELPAPMHIFGALDVNARNFDVQLRIAGEKVESGICGFLTQPVLTEKALNNLRIARKELDAYILGGIIPVVSAKNARFMNSEINGIEVDERIISLYEGKNREEAEDLAVTVSVAIAREMQGYVDGYYLMTPFQRTGLMCRIMDEIRALEKE